MSRIQSDNKSEMARIRTDIERGREDKTGMFQDKMLGYFMTKAGTDPLDNMEKLASAMSLFKDLSGGGGEAEKEEKDPSFMETMGTIVGSAAKAMTGGEPQQSTLQQPQPTPWNGAAPPQIAQNPVPQAIPPVPQPTIPKRVVKHRPRVRAAPAPTPAPPTNLVPQPSSSMEAPDPNEAVRKVTPEMFERMKRAGLIVHAPEPEPAEPDAPKYAMENFKSVINHGVTTRPNPEVWALESVELLTQEGKNALLDVENPSEIVSWVSMAGVEPLSLVSVLADPKAQDWIRNSVAELQNIIRNDITSVDDVESTITINEGFKELAEKGE